jgi:hypothetical protein
MLELEEEQKVKKYSQTPKEHINDQEKMLEIE